MHPVTFFKVGLFALILITAPMISFAQNRTVMQQEVIKVPGITSDSMIYNLSVEQKQTTRVYYDGLGRALQNVTVKGSPLYKDIVQPIAYDLNGNQPKSYLPYVAEAGTGAFRLNALIGEQAAFYNNGKADKVADDAMPYQQQLFESSPLWRVLQIGQTGAGFQPLAGQHYKSINYRSNNSATDGGIIIWDTEGLNGGNYIDGTLAVTEVTDEDGKKALVFTDNEERTVLKRQMLDLTHQLDTYYIYNSAGQLYFIVPPKAVAIIKANGYALTQESVASLVFKNSYDDKGRLSSKTVPGKGDIYIIYDPLDRPVLVQDANLRATQKWNFIKYDVQGRAVLQGIYTDAIHLTRVAMQTYADGMATSYNTGWYESRTNVSATGFYTNNIFPTTGTTILSAVYFDDYDLNLDGTADYFYTGQGLIGEAAVYTNTRGMATITRTATVGLGVSTIWLVKAIFYDKHGNTIQIKSNNHLNTALNDIATSVPDFTGTVLQTKVQKYHSTTMSTIVLSSYNYDHMNRLKNVKQRYNNETNDRLVVGYDYNELGQLISKKLGQNGSGSVPSTLNLSTVYSGINNFTASESITLSNGFSVPLGSSFSASIAGNSLQKVDYRYNIRGQLTSINNSKLVADNSDPNLNTNDDSNDVFGEEILYDKSSTTIGNIALYSGSISAVKWMSMDGSKTKSNERSYKYSYDGSGRFIQSIYAERPETATTTTSFALNLNGFTEKITGYDENGNIQGLTRFSSTVGGSSGTKVDGLKYTYDASNSNRLLSVKDSTGNATGFQNYTGSTGSYVYDGSGNLTADPFKGISAIVYNTLNRVDKVTFNLPSATGRYIDYTYDATGKLLRKRIFDNSVLQNTTDYVDGFQYASTGNGAATLDFFAMPEGRVRNNGTGSSITLKQEFVITDHQGNARISFEDNGSGQALVKQENSYYAFGMNMTSTMAQPTSPNKNLYNGGSEWQNDFGNQPDWQQTFYRNYDQAIGRFLAVDPMAEESDAMTVYQYAGNNPVMMNDPLGDLQQYGGRQKIQDYSNGLYGDIIDNGSDGGDGGGGGLYSGFWTAYLLSGTLDFQTFKNDFKEKTGGSYQGGAYYYIDQQGKLEVQASGTNNSSIVIQGEKGWTYNDFKITNQGGDPHAAELAKYGQVVAGVNSSISVGLAGTGIVIEYGTVSTDKNWHQNYKTIYKNATPLALAGSLGLYGVVSKHGVNTTFSDFAGPVTGVTANYGFVSLSYQYSTTYRTFGIGFGPGISIPVRGTGAYLNGVTTYTGQPYYHDASAGYDPDVGHIVH
jgi:RHS repeat-associated protein